MYNHCYTYQFPVCIFNYSSIVYNHEKTAHWSQIQQNLGLGCSHIADFRYGYGRRELWTVFEFGSGSWYSWSVHFSTRWSLRHAIYWTQQIVWSGQNIKTLQAVLLQYRSQLAGYNSHRKITTQIIINAWITLRKSPLVKAQRLEYFFKRN